jgi:hypothetical protein
MIAILYVSFHSSIQNYIFSAINLAVSVYRKQDFALANRILAFWVELGGSLTQSLSAAGSTSANA